MTAVPAMTAHESLPIQQLGLVRYAEALRLMNEAHGRVKQGAAVGRGEILLVEHPPVVTMGNRFLPEDMILGEDDLLARGIDFHRIDRGGSVTVHEPGQAVVYPILKLGPKLGPKAFVHALEDAMITLCAEYGFEAARDAVNPGVWVAMNKIGAIGIRIDGGVSKHGLAFNVTNTLSAFETIVPCGLRGRGVTNLERESRVRTFRPLCSFEVGGRLAVLVRERLLAITST